MGATENRIANSLPCVVQVRISQSGGAGERRHRLRSGQGVRPRDGGWGGLYQERCAAARG